MGSPSAARIRLRCRPIDGVDTGDSPSAPARRRGASPAGRLSRPFPNPTTRYRSNDYALTRVPLEIIRRKHENEANHRPIEIARDDDAILFVRQR